MEQVIKTSLNSLQEILEGLVSSNKEMEQRIHELEQKVKTLELVPEPVPVPALEPALVLELEPEPAPEPVPVSKRVSELNKKVEDLEKEENEKANKKAIILEEKDDDESVYNSGGEQPAPDMPSASNDDVDDPNVFEADDGNKYIYIDDGNNFFYKIEKDGTIEEDPCGQALNYGDDEKEEISFL